MVMSTMSNRRIKTYISVVRTDSCHAMILSFEWKPLPATMHYSLNKRPFCLCYHKCFSWQLIKQQVMMGQIESRRKRMLRQPCGHNLTVKDTFISSCVSVCSENFLLQISPVVLCPTLFPLDVSMNSTLWTTLDSRQEQLHEQTPVPKKPDTSRCRKKE